MLNRRRFLRFSSVLLPLGAVLGMAGCAGASSAKLPGADITATDYSRSEHWLSAPTHIDKPVDVFYLYSTAWRKVSTTDPNMCEINNPSMLAGAKFAFARQATAFETVANIFAPYYRQADATYTLGLAQAEREQVIATQPSVDALAAFDYFIQHHNHGRPFILAGHSQGSNVLLNILSDYMTKRPDVYRRMVAAYVIGYSVTSDYLARNPHLKFAQGPMDTGVIVSYNTQAPDVPAGKNPVVLPGALVINPLSWTRTPALADRSLNLGAFMPVSTSSFERLPEFADAQVNVAKGVLLTTADPTGLRLGLGPGVYHSYDYSFYYFNIRENAANRVSRYP
jgi:hypothetical protein